jgi:hypothetical protein
MAAREMEVLLVQSSGPIKRYKLRPGLITFLAVLLVFLLAVTGVGGYFFYRQLKFNQSLVQQNTTLKRSSEDLRVQISDMQARLAVAQAAPVAAKEASKAEGSSSEASSQASEEKPGATASPETPAVPPRIQSPGGASSESQEKTAESTSAEAEGENGKQQEAQKQEEQKTAQAETQPAAKEEKKKKELLPEEPTESDEVDVRVVRQNSNKRSLTLVYDVVNKQEEGAAEGYVTVVVRGSRQGKPWIEASPPMRLSPLGRPLNYRRGTAYSVQRYRRLKATFPVADKRFERLEMLLYSRAGDLLLVKIIDLTEKKGEVDHLSPRYGKV